MKGSSSDTGNASNDGSSGGGYDDADDRAGNDKHE